MIRITIAKPDHPSECMDFDKPAEVAVGRSSHCEIILDFDPLVSRRHAVFIIDDGSVRIRDLDSTNGLRINGEQFGGGSLPDARTPLELRDGDEVMIGGTLFRVELNPEQTRSPRQSAPKPPSQRLFVPDDGVDAAVNETIVSASDALPPHVPGYRLLRNLAVGRFGKIYFGVSKGEERFVAVRVMYPPGGLTPDLLKVFFGEFDTVRHVVHPNLARLWGAGELAKGGGVFVAAEYVAGVPMTAYLARRPGGKLLSGEAVGIMLQVAGAVCRLHRQNITHLDLKPASVIVREDIGRVVAKVTDAGLSDFAEMAGLAPPAYAGHDAERLSFMAPEQLSGGTKAGMRTDVFALSAMMFAMMAGRPPYRFSAGGDNRAVVERGEVLRLGDVVKEVPEVLQEIVQVGLSSDPGGRYADAGQFLAALEGMVS